MSKSPLSSNPAYASQWIRLFFCFVLGVCGSVWISVASEAALPPSLQPTDQALSVQHTALLELETMGHRHGYEYEYGYSHDYQDLLAQLPSQLEEGRNAYESGNLDRAETILMQVLRDAQGQGNQLVQAIALSNLALVKGQQGQWPTANQNITDSLALLESMNASGHSDRPSVLAQALNIRGRLAFGQGQSDAAYDSWGEAAALFHQMGDRRGQVRSLLKQARALQSQGYYRQAVLDILGPLQATLQTEPDSLLKVINLLNLAEAFQTIKIDPNQISLEGVGPTVQSLDSLEMAQQVAAESLKIANRLEHADAIAASQLSLGNIAYAKAMSLPSSSDIDLGAIATDRKCNQSGSETRLEAVQTALACYDPVIVTHSNALNNDQLRAQVNKLRLLVDIASKGTQPIAAVKFWQTDVSPCLEQRTEGSSCHRPFPVSREGIYARINLADSLLRLKFPGVYGKTFFAAEDIDIKDIKAVLTTAQQHANQLGDQRATAYVLGYLGKFYEDTGEIAEAQRLTQQGLLLAQSVNAADITYRWYEQSGRLWEKLFSLQDNDSFNTQAQAQAIAAYSGAVQTLKTLRTDLAVIAPEGQFSFKTSIEPLHRRLVSLILSDPSKPDTPQRLDQARLVMESLQVEELNNFLQAACLDGQRVALENVVDKQKAAVIYPIVLEDRIEIILRLPQEHLRRSTSANIAKTKLKDITQQLRDTISTEFYQDTSDYEEPAQHLYKLLIEPIEADLARSSVETLVFVLDGEIRNLPMAALSSDGQHFLVEDYAIAIAPGLHLVDPKPLRKRELKALTFGLTEAVDGFSPLPEVEVELNNISNTISSEQWLNEDFTQQQLATSLKTLSGPIVHLATHGNFSSQLEQTFILASNGKISVNDLSLWIQESNRPIELLVLSACETATGDQNAALGLAGMAVRAGARSTLASLWQVDDVATSELMKQFYIELAEADQISKAKALQNAQQQLLSKGFGFDHPYYWAPFILVGNWL